ncbi:BTAD domain-containing putative transcriptional regulator [Actinomadura meridiana]|uniref:BTAD domain-containing putative transcriptional regulator n=1 Tax=Actinomadura meridiana TaxID=559626 RepID=A0ABP8CPW1_9ACTN
MHRFERLAGEARRAAGEGRFEVAGRVYEEALGLWRGDALADVSAPFAAGQAARLEEERASVVEAWAEAKLAVGDGSAVLVGLRELVHAQPLRERARALLMRALHGSGRQTEALAVFEDGRRVLAEELGADPSRELADVHLAILRGEEEGFRANLPAQLTSFVGREEELRRVGKMLADRRLVTLLGPGGAGKTRLAVEAAEREDGDVCFVDLAPVGGGEVAKAVLGALGLREGAMLPAPGGQPGTVERLVTALERRRLLLVLDNCEHVVADIATLAHRLLSACPRLRVLATSREALGITGEALRPLPPLELPPDGVQAREAAVYPAVRLFLDRAEAVRPGFAVDDDNVATVVGICRALDGLPLAIELAAARLRSLPVGEVATRLNDRFRLLSRGDRSAPPRHRTLRAVVEWSWDLLDDTEQALARRLTVFSGGFTLDAAVGISGQDADELVAELADKSLVQSDGARYRMLDTVRAFCAERLAEAGEAERFERRHAVYFLDLARRAEPHLRGPEQLEWLERLAADHGNLHAALRRSVRGDRAVALKLTAALAWYWWLRGRVEGAPLTTELLDAIGDDPVDDLEEEYVLCVTSAMGGGVTGERAVAWLDRAEAMQRRIRRPLAHPVATVLWALTAGPDRTDMDVFAMQIGDDPWSRALTRMSDVFVAQAEGDVAEVERAGADALAGFRACGDRWGIANSLDPLAQVAARRGDRDRALELLDEALALMERLGAPEDTGDLLFQRGFVHILGGDLDTARADFERGLAMARRAGTPDKIAGGHQGLGEVARRRGDVAEARRQYEMALTGFASERFIAASARGSALVGLGWLAVGEGEHARARELFFQALDMSMDHPIFMYRALAGVGLAGVAVAEGDGARAATLLGAAAALQGVQVAGDADMARVSDAARDLVGDAAYEAAFAAGADLSREDAHALLTHH